MKTVILFFICFLRFAVISNSQSIESITPSTGFSGNYIVLLINTQNTSFTTWDMDYYSFRLIQMNDTIEFQWISEIINDSAIRVAFVLPFDKPLGYYNLMFQYNKYPIDITMIKASALLVEPNPTPPVINSINPISFMVDKLVNLDIVTTNTQFIDNNWTEAYLVKGADTIHSYIIKVNDSTHIKVKFLIPIDFPLGSCDLHLRAFFDDWFKCENCLTIAENPYPAHLVSCSPGSVIQGGDINLEVAGTNTSFAGFDGYDLNVILRKSDNHEIATDWDHYDIHGFEYALNDSTIHFSCTLNYLLPPGIYDVITQDPLCDTLVLYNGLTVLEGPLSPSVVSIQPDTIYIFDSSGNLNQLEWLTVTGKNTFFDPSNMCDYLYFYDHYIGDPSYGIEHYKYINDTCIQVDVRPFQYESGWNNFYFGNGVENLWYYKAFYIDNPTYGIKEVASGSFRLFPNPSTGIVTLETQETLNHPAEVTILNITGQIIEKTEINAGNNNLNFDLSGKQKGVYMVKLSTVSGSYTQKLILQ